MAFYVCLFFCKFLDAEANSVEMPWSISFNVGEWEKQDAPLWWDTVETGAPAALSEVPCVCPETVGRAGILTALSILHQWSTLRSAPHSAYWQGRVPEVRADYTIRFITGGNERNLLRLKVKSVIPMLNLISQLDFNGSEWENVFENHCCF